MVQYEPDEHRGTHVIQGRRANGVAAPRAARLILAERYEVLEEIGSGATAITYRGHDHRLNRNVAIKILREDHALDPGFVRRFEREARAAASISQGNVVDIYDVGEEDGDLYIVMQYIDGEDLKRFIAREGALDAARARQITTQVLAGLAAIHAAGIIHRDIKPQNVMIGSDGNARVTDFGVAQAAVDVGLTSAGTTVGTAAYMAPEQARADVLGETTDIYAVGVVLYEMLTGQMPFTAATPVAMMLAHIQCEPVSPSVRAPDSSIPDDLDAIVIQAMAKDPADRFQSASAMSRALAGGTAQEGSTTRLSAVPVQMTTRVVSEPIAAVSAPARELVVPTGPASSGSAAAPPRVVLRPARAGSRLRSSAGGLLLLLALVLAGGGAYGANELFGRGDDSSNERTPPARNLVSSGTATATPPNTASASGAILPSDEPIATGTSITAAGLDDPTSTAVLIRTPAQSPPTAEPTSPPTAPSPTAVPPTEVPPPAVLPTNVPPTSEPTTQPTERSPTEAPPTAVPPTDVPPPPTEAPVEQPTVAPAAAVPNQVGQGSNLASRVTERTPVSSRDTRQPGTLEPGTGTSGSSKPPDAVRGSGQAQARGEITIDHNDWKGDGAEKASDQEWTVVGPGKDVTARFDVDNRPADGTFKVSIALAGIDTDRVPLRILFNGTERLQITDPLPMLSSGGNGQGLGNLVLTVPSRLLQDGRNELTVVNAGTGGSGHEDGDDDDDSDDDEPESQSIAVGDVVITIDGSP